MYTLSKDIAAFQFNDLMKPAVLLIMSKIFLLELHVFYSHLAIVESKLLYGYANSSFFPFTG